MMRYQPHIYFQSEFNTAQISWHPKIRRPKMIHIKLPDGWPKPTLCGKLGKRAVASFSETPTCKACLKIEAVVNYPWERTNDGC
jgi:hypothetical protein